MMISAVLHTSLMPFFCLMRMCTRLCKENMGFLNSDLPKVSGNCKKAAPFPFQSRKFLKSPPGIIAPNAEICEDIIEVDYMYEILSDLRMPCWS